MDARYTVPRRVELPRAAWTAGYYARDAPARASDDGAEEAHL